MKPILIGILITVFVISACRAQPTQAPPALAPTQMIEPVFTPSGDLPLTEREVPRVSVQAAKVALESGAAILVDVRSPAAYEKSHIAGSISIPLGEIERNLASLTLDRDKWIITYCTWQDEHQSARAAYILLYNGYTRVDALQGGFAAWIDAGLPIEP